MKLATTLLVSVLAATGCTSMQGVPGGNGSAEAPKACAAKAPCTTPIGATWCSIAVVEKIEVTAKGIDLVWNLEHGVLGYTFDGEGISIDDRDHQFGRPQISEDRRTITISDANNYPIASPYEKPYKYTVHIRNAFKQCKDPDPTIVNKG
jgi:hypothetical protein